jgi:hypothetical protein
MWCRIRLVRHIVKQTHPIRQYSAKKRLKIPKGVTSIRKSKTNRQHNGQKTKDKRTNNDLQNITHKTKDRVTWTLLKTGVNSCVPEEKTVPVPLVAPVVLLIGHKWGTDSNFWNDVEIQQPNKPIKESNPSPSFEMV